MGRPLFLFTTSYIVSWPKSSLSGWTESFLRCCGVKFAMLIGHLSNDSFDGNPYCSERPQVLTIHRNMSALGQCSRVICQEFNSFTRTSDIQPKFSFKLSGEKFNCRKHGSYREKNLPFTKNEKHWNLIFTFWYRKVRIDSEMSNDLQHMYIFPHPKTSYLPQT